MAGHREQSLNLVGRKGRGWILSLARITGFEAFVTGKAHAGMKVSGGVKGKGKRPESLKEGEGSAFTKKEDIWREVTLPRIGRSKGKEGKEPRRGGKHPHLTRLVLGRLRGGIKCRFTKKVTSCRPRGFRAGVGGTGPRI